MVFPERMKRIHIIVHNSKLELLIKKLHQLGLFQINDTRELDEKICKHLDFHLPHYEVLGPEEAYLRIEKIIELLNTIKEEKKTTIKEMLFPKPFPVQKIEDRSRSEVLNEAKRTLTQIESSILGLWHDREQAEERLSQIKEKVKIMNQLESLKIPLNYIEDSGFTHIRLGYIKEFNKFEAQYKADGQTFSYYAFQVGMVENEKGVVVVSTKEKAKEMDQFLHKRHFQDYDIQSFKEEKTPEMFKMELQGQTQALAETINQVDASLKAYRSQWMDRLEVLFEELAIERDRDDIIKNFGRTKTTSVISGWAPTRGHGAVVNLAKANGAVVYTDDPEADEEHVPIKLRNPGWIRPFEGMTKLFGVPKYNEMDPTMIMGILFTFYFGVMLGDAGYGLIMLLGCLFMYFSIGKVSPFARQAGYIGIWLSVMTIIAGLYFGSVFGDLIPRYVYGDPDAVLFSIAGFQPYNALKEPMGILIFSLIAGIITLDIGILLGAVTNLRNKKFKVFIITQLPWVFIQPGAGLLLLHGFFGLITLPGWAIILCAVSFGIGFILLFIDTKIMCLFDLTGFLGDWLSFTRLMALGLGTTGIALVINVLVDLIANYGTIPYMIIISIVAVVMLAALHLFNIAIQALGAGIHSMRLQFVELFGKFFEGGGDEFEPFAPNRKITEVSGENNQ